MVVQVGRVRFKRKFFMLNQPENTNFQIHCPTAHCSGWVCFIDEFYGCGECGNVWFSKDELDTAINEIIKKYPYRNQVYQKIDNTYQPNDTKLPNYDKLIETEDW